MAKFWSLPRFDALILSIKKESRCVEVFSSSVLLLDEFDKKFNLILPILLKLIVMASISHALKLWSRDWASSSSRIPTLTKIGFQKLPQVFSFVTVVCLAQGENSLGQHLVLFIPLNQYNNQRTKNVFLLDLKFV